MLRKLAPYLLFLTLGLAMLAGAVYAPLLIAKFYHAVPAAGPAASGAEIAAGQQASGWVPSATVASKFIAALGALVLMVLAIWKLQAATHPEPTRWAKEDYTNDFQALTPVEKFEVYGRVRLQYVILASAALLFGALVL